GYREKILGQKVYLFDPFNKRTHRYNPLAYIDMNSDNADGQLTDFANILYPMTGDSTTQFFNQLAQNLFIGICYIVHDLLNSQGGIILLKKLNAEIDFTLYGILQMSEGFKGEVNIDGERKIIFKAFDDTYNVLAELGLIGKKAQMRCQSYFKIDSDNTKSGVMSSFNAPLMMFRNDNMRLATSANDFDFRDLRKEKMTIYIGITPDQLANAKLILNIFWQQLILVNTKELPQANPELKYKVLLVMDEFTAPGYLSIYLKSISFIAGYWLRSLMIYQSGSQLEANQPDGYGREGAKTLLTNHACQIFYTPREQEDAEKISKILGTKTIKNRSRNLGQGGGGSESDTGRALMLAQELREMPFEDELITIDNGKPIMAKKAFYYSDSYFMNKFKEVSPSLRAIDGKEYEKEQYEEIIDKKTKKSQKRIKIKQNGKIPSRGQLEKAIQNGETNIKVPLQNMANIKSYFKELYNDEGERFEKLPEIVREIDENQEEYEKKLRLQRDRDETSKQEAKKLQEQYEIEQSGKANESVENIDTDPVADETINGSDSDEEQMAQNATCPNYDELDDENQDYSE
ncbi:TPA: type IV secretory system conjugative DNA transfer family protein, partial [Campylobacter fetus subsp. venerealis]|nr:type IV secretory system conjugative DNA transfer family protein [Campylobacter fetus subsp. venerealis]HDX6242531.1 type IV secretory system conjugative DNA transfer family protein [Campylobacter fetus subsp. venerealis]HDX6244678.1 type IV secretory system conjugative DNA transfer family protein [Campylobacter fetus subsp. venerealis]HDX6246540.1 type IV secretory system conjugative DNA transfer family protein [Campylobacter fetus subsp. venerealis]HDX6252460.1 type IV secretory system con